MNSVLHRAETRGEANHGWLRSKHSFSFGNYYNPERIQFGMLRVLNDDLVAPGKGFGTHDHENMEIISIPLEGALEHADSMGSMSVIRCGEIQVLSAGTGISHSEYNHSKKEAVKFLQIWILPKTSNVKPRYGQITLNIDDRRNQFDQILSPNKEGKGVWIHQDAWFSMTRLNKGKELSYSLNNPITNGVYVFVLSGIANVNNQSLKGRDGFGLWNLSQVNIEAQSDVELLLIEVPMN